MTFTNLYKITVKQKWQLNAWRTTLCFMMQLLNIKTLTTKAQQRESQTFRLTGVGPSLMKTSVLILTCTQAGGGEQLPQTREKDGKLQMAALTKGKKHTCWWGWGGWGRGTRIIRPGQACSFSTLICLPGFRSESKIFLCDYRVNRITVTPGKGATETAPTVPATSDTFAPLM